MEKKNGFESLIQIFVKPRKAFETIVQKPHWLVPFLIMVIITLAMQWAIHDIAISDTFRQLHSQGIDPEKIDTTQNQIQRMRFVNLGVTPLSLGVVWLVLAGVLFFIGNTIMGGQSHFKTIFSIVAWSELVEVPGIIIKTFLILAKGTLQGVTTSLVILLPVLQEGESPSFLYRLLLKIDLFTGWKMILWIIGLSLAYRFPISKTTRLVLFLWGFWILASVSLSYWLAHLFAFSSV